MGSPFICGIEIFYISFVSTGSMERIDLSKTKTSRLCENRMWKCNPCSDILTVKDRVDPE